MNLSATENLEIIDHLLTTTRSVRKRLDFERPVEPDVLVKCLNIAIQAPTGSNMQTWHFMIVTDDEKRKQVANLYRKAWGIYLQGGPLPSRASDEQVQPVISSAAYLAENLHKVPTYVIPCIDGRVEQADQFMQASIYGSILPAVWSLMLALRARGVGSAWTTLHLMFANEIAQILGIPDTITQTALLPVAYFKGQDFKIAERVPISEYTYWNNWDQEEL